MFKQTVKIAPITVLSALTALIVLFLAGCASTPTANAPAATNTSVTSTLPTSTPQPTVTIRPTATISPAGPITPVGWTTYHGAITLYSIEYPANWYVSDPASLSDATAGSLDVENFDPRSNQFNTEGIPGPPYTKLEVRVVSNSAHLSPSAFLQAQLSDEAHQYGTPTPGSVVTKNVQIAGQSALQVYFNRYSVDVPTLAYIVPDRDVMLLIFQYSVTSGEPSPVLAHVITSLHLGA